MRILAFDTSSPCSAVAVLDGERVLAEDDAAGSGRHGDVLLPRIARQLECAGLALAELELIAVGIGPGSFTGIRIGLATAKGLALATALPLCGVSSLRVLARDAAVAGLIASVLEAGKGELFGALHRRRGDGLETVLEGSCAPPAVLAAQLRAATEEPIALAGDPSNPQLAALRVALGTGAELYAAQIRGRHVAAEARVEFARRGASDAATLAPLYLRGSDAKLPARALALD